MARDEAQAVRVAQGAQRLQARGVERRRRVGARERVARVAVELDVADVLGLQVRERALEARGATSTVRAARRSSCVGGAGAAGQVISPAPLLRCSCSSRRAGRPSGLSAHRRRGRPDAAPAPCRRMTESRQRPLRPRRRAPSRIPSNCLLLTPGARLAASPDLDPESPRIRQCEAIPKCRTMSNLSHR